MVVGNFSLTSDFMAISDSNQLLQLVTLYFVHRQRKYIYKTRCFYVKNVKYGDDVTLLFYGRHAHRECRLNI